MPKQTFFRLAPERQQQVLDAAKLAFSQRPYEEVNVTELITKMGIATGSFYQYFEDKKDLYFYVLKSYIDQLHNWFAENNQLLKMADNTGTMGRYEQAFAAATGDSLYKAVSLDMFALAAPNIKRDWYFDVVMGQGLLDMYDSSFIDSKPSAQICKDNRHVIMAMLLSIRSILDLFVSRADEPQRFNQLYKMCMDIIKNGVFTIQDDPQ